MKKLLPILILVLVVGAGGYFFMQSQSAPKDGRMESTGTGNSDALVAGNVVTIKDFAFSTQTLTIKAGQSVVWKNEDVAGHSATADGGSFDTQIIASGESSEPVVFDTPGTFAYHCTPHPNMKATIVVTE